MPKVLVVDGDRLTCEIIADDLQDGLGAVVECERTGLLGAQALRSEKFDLALIEAELPDMSGFELAEIAANENTTTLLLTGIPTIIDELKAFDWHYIRKPLTTDVLLEASRQALAQTSNNIARVKASAIRMQATAKALQEASARSLQLLDEAHTNIQNLVPAGFPAPYQNFSNGGTQPAPLAAGLSARCTSRLVNRNVMDGATRTSMRFEPEFWDAIHEVCMREDISLSTLIDRAMHSYGSGGRTSAVRTFILAYFRTAR